MQTINELRQVFNEYVEKQQLIKAPENLYKPIEYSLATGGKKMRPVLLLLSTEMFGGNIQNALGAALGIEMFHNFTLLHDDIMDKSPLRRGNPTVHEKWDNNTAILSGDTMLVMAFQYFLKTKSEKLVEILDLFAKTAREVCEGQQYDMQFETCDNVSIDEYLEMIRLKTAVLLGAGLKTGAYLGGANESDCELIYQFGEKTGLAFQLMDDLLDVYGSADKFGKRTGNDILTNKRTFLLIRAFELASKEDAKKLNWWLAQKDNDDEKVIAVTDIYNHLNIKAETEKKIETLHKQGLGFLEKIDLASEYKKELISFTNRLKIRDH